MKASLRGPGVTVFDVLNATDYVTPVLEILDTRIVRIDPDTKKLRNVFDTISDNAGIVMDGRRHAREQDPAAGREIIGRPPEGRGVAQISRKPVRQADGHRRSHGNLQLRVDVERTRRARSAPVELTTVYPCPNNVLEPSRRIADGGPQHGGRVHPSSGMCV